MLLTYQIFAFIFGSLVGSFANVLVYRIPKKMNFTTDRSKCPSCDKQIPWYENIPVLGYLYLRGKCSACKYKIPIQYLAMELVLGLAALLLAPKDLNPVALANFIFKFTVFTALTVHFVIDVKHRILPDGINIYLGVIFLLFAIVNYHWGYWLLGGLIGFLFPLGVTYLFYMIKKKVGLGGGDIKLFGVLGIILGPIGIVHNIFLSCMLGSITLLPLILLKLVPRDAAIPFGPFIIVVAVAQIYFPQYFRMLVTSLF